VSLPEHGGFSLPKDDQVAPSERAPAREFSIPVTQPEPVPAPPPIAARDFSLPSMPPPDRINDRSDDQYAPVAPPSGDEIGIVAVDTGARSSRGVEIILDELLLYLLEHGGSDLHLSINSPPVIRVNGDLEQVPGYSSLTPHQLQETIYSILTERQKQRFEEAKELDLAYALPGAARFRVNLMRQQGSVGAVLRAIPWEILPLDALKMPPILGDFATLPRGLVLVTGPTGSGKSTTLAAIIDRANRTRRSHIITIEDPIEFVHRHRLCVVNQREVGEDTLSFQDALKHALRQDPDIILVGELRDLETIQIALTAAETGHLVFGTLHTSSAGSTIDRIIDVFPGDQQSQIRTQLAASLQAVVCQTLCRTTDHAGRVAATEVMVATPAIRNMIREGKLQSIPSALQTGTKYGMHTLNQDLAELVKRGTITYEIALEKSSDPSELQQLLGMASNATD
jgi:twitching motility protein PilT